MSDERKSPPAAQADAAEPLAPELARMVRERPLPEPAAHATREILARAREKAAAHGRPRRPVVSWALAAAALLLLGVGAALWLPRNWSGNNNPGPMAQAPLETLKDDPDLAWGGPAADAATPRAYAPMARIDWGARTSVSLDRRLTSVHRRSLTLRLTSRRELVSLSPQTRYRNPNDTKPYQEA